jgi:DMSO/TMAO reductase YedYZ molybdopterin-dependent catalytic subunit
VRVQRVPAEWPVLHLEAETPPAGDLVVDGLVRHPFRLSIEDLRALGDAEQAIPLHCVWGWSRPAAVWRGVALAAVLDVAEPLPSASHVVVSSGSGVYSSCLDRADAADGFLAWGRDGGELSPEAGWPLRFVAPPSHWAYKHVKWTTHIELVDRFSPGLWESKVADPIGRIPEDVWLP